MKEINKNEDNKAIGREKLKGIWPVLVTPYTPDLKIDIGAYRQMIEFHLEAGCHGIYALCLSSEMHLLNLKEQKTLVQEAVDVCAGEIPVAITGNLGKDIVEQLSFAQWAQRVGADVIMLTVPVDKDLESDIESYFCTFQAQTDANLGIYECPFPIHRTLSASLVQRLAITNRFHAYKETSCDLPNIREKAHRLEDTSLSLLQANIPYLLDALDVGADGSMNVVANWLPELVVEIFEKYQKNMKEEARQLHAALCTFEMMQRSIHPVGVKYLMSLRGIDISPKTRRSQKLSKEEKKSLDKFAGIWFDQSGKLRLDMAGKLFSLVR